MEELQKRHRQEQRDLQALVTQKRKNATKKTRKGVNDECAELERALKERQQQELDALTDSPQNGVNGPDREPGASVEREELPVPTSDDAEKIQRQIRNLTVQDASQTPPKRPNRQKARLARRAAEQEALATQAADEAQAMPDQRAAEQELMVQEMMARGLVEKEVRSDGHCLYAAVADQLQQQGRKLDESDGPAYRFVRRQTAAFIESHPDDFAPFLEEPLDSYTAKIRDTGEWGGQLELSALARIFDLRIQVLQSSGRVETIGDGSAQGAEIWLAYYRHSFGLGEHYNSLRKRA